MRLKYVSCSFNKGQGIIIWFPTHLLSNGYKQQLEWNEWVCVFFMDSAVNSSCECFSIALDSRFLKGLSGGSGVIVLGQVNWPQLAAKLSKIGVVLYNSFNASAVGHFTCLQSKTPVSIFGRKCKTETHSVMSVCGTRRFVILSEHPVLMKSKSFWKTIKACLFCLTI